MFETIGEYLGYTRVESWAKIHAEIVRASKDLASTANAMMLGREIIGLEEDGVKLPTLGEYLESERREEN